MHSSSFSSSSPRQTPVPLLITMDSAVPHLCDHCSQICFDALRGPSVSELHEVSDGRMRRTRAAGITHKVHLASLARIEQSAADGCSLCQLFLHVIGRQGGGALLLPGSYLRDDGVHFYADPDLSYYGHIVEPDWNGGEGERRLFVVRRLCLTAHSKDGSTLAYIDHIVQPCEIPPLCRPRPSTAASSQASSKLDADTMTSAQDAMLFGGRRRDLVVDTTRLLDWVSICESTHGGLCSSDGRALRVEAIRLVDVSTKTLRVFKDADLSKFKYAALSYVWGTTGTKLTLKRGNAEELLAPGALQHRKLPQTIADAVELAERLRIRYLWIDALCIIQDDDNDQQIQIGNMAKIYRSAFVAFVAAAGKDSDAGLPGVRPGTRTYVQQEVVVVPPTHQKEGLSLLTTVKSQPPAWDEFYSRGFEDIDFSVWNSRAWTMQERALSRRSLIFTDEQVLWSCHFAFFCEESIFEVPRTKFRHFNRTTHQLVLQPNTGRRPQVGDAFWDRYAALVDNYTRRSLTEPGDVHDAFSAVINELESVSGELFLWGLPRSRFELSLSWDTFHGLQRRYHKSKLPMTSLATRVTFPSWSWMGWFGDAHCWVTDERRISDTSQLVCFTHQSHPKLNFIRVNTGDGLSSSDDYARPSWQDPHHTEVSESDVIAQYPHLTDNRLSEFPDEHLLFFWTSVVSESFTVPEHKAKVRNFAAYGSRSMPEVLDRDGRAVGSACTMKRGHWDSYGCSGPTEFAVVGRRLSAEIPDETPKVLALQIERKEGIAYRVNLAVIEESAWIAAGPKWALVVLG
ncbi:heterokaryon incompatibility protein-domain-containing protein [Fomes fomentarius]|nr:heterokaryon incompatibility protein-domain-containing protein [Fomes fomentarius]